MKMKLFWWKKLELHPAFCNHENKFRVFPRVAEMCLIDGSIVGHKSTDHLGFCQGFKSSFWFWKQQFTKVKHILYFFYQNLFFQIVIRKSNVYQFSISYDNHSQTIWRSRIHWKQNFGPFLAKLSISVPLWTHYYRTKFRKVSKILSTSIRLRLSVNSLRTLALNDIVMCVH